jgi:hypothetical protein
LTDERFISSHRIGFFAKFVSGVLIRILGVNIAWKKAEFSSRQVV